MLKEKLKTNQPVIGIWSILNLPVVTEIMGLAGLDFVILDMEHGVFDLSALASCISAAEASGCSPLVRVPSVGHSMVQNILDLRAHGIIFPQVHDYQQAIAAVKSTKFLPDGTRGYNPFTRYGSYAGGMNEAQPKLDNDFALTGIIIENEATVKDLDRIIDIPQLDLLYLGIYDLSLALDCKGNFNDPKIIKFLETAIPKIRKAGKSVGVLVKNEIEMKRFLELGANFLVYIVDSYVIKNAMAEGPRMLKMTRKLPLDNRI